MDKRFEDRGKGGWSGVETSHEAVNSVGRIAGRKCGESWRDNWPRRTQPSFTYL